jgi:hypothetical protein
MPGRMVARQMAAGLVLPVRQAPAVARARALPRAEAPYTRIPGERFVARLARTDQAEEPTRHLAADWMAQQRRMVDWLHPRPG